MNIGFGLTEMNIVMRFISLILACLPLVVHSDDGSSKGPGNTPCLYYGDMATQCNMSTLDPSQIPDDCTGIIFMDASVDDNYTISLSADSQIEYLKALLACEKKVFLYYTHLEYPLGWPNALRFNIQDGGERVKLEMDGIGAFLQEYPGLAGLVLYYLDPGVFPDDYACPTENFQIYLEAMRETFPDLSIGLDFSTKDIIEYHDDPVGQWLDFSILDSLIDFYIVNTFNSHQCSRDLIQTGGYPLTGDYAYTVEMAMEYAAEANIPKEKCLIQFTTGATSQEDITDFCSMGNTMLCLHPENFYEVCTDSMQTYFEKGQYVAENAKGFLLDCLDVDDPGGVCCCPGGPFPAFHALLDGFNGVDAPPNCPKYDKVLDVEI